MEKVALRRYEKYKESGVEWLGEIPEHWALTRLGTKFEERRTKVSDKDFLPLSVTKNGTVPQLSNAAKTNDGDNRKLVKKGDFVINSRSDRKGSSGIAFQDGSVSLINIVIKPNGINPTYCNYLLKSYNFVEEFYRMGHGIVADLWTTRYDEMRSILIGIPTPIEQTAIANFLDDKCGKIDQAIARKERLIELLKERKQILIQNAVTGKVSNYDLNDGYENYDSKEKNHSQSQNLKNHSPRPMKDSGVKWIGKIPEGWEVKALKYIAYLQSGETISAQKFVIEGFPVYGGNGFRGYTDTYTNKGLFALIGRQGALCGNVNYARGKFFASEHAIVVYPLKKEDVLWLGETIKVADFNRLSQSAAQPGIAVNVIKNVLFPYPPIKEQITISKYIETHSAKIDKAISLQQQQIEKLKEYKASLINSAVTGKIKVCEL